MGPSPGSEAEREGTASQGGCGAGHQESGNKQDMRGKREGQRGPPRWGGSQRLVSFSRLPPCRDPAWRWGRGPCWGGCRPDSVALWFTRDKSRSHPVTTVEAAAASQGHRVPAFSQTPQQGWPPPILRTWRLPASQCILVLLSCSGSAKLLCKRLGPYIS